MTEFANKSGDVRQCLSSSTSYNDCTGLTDRLIGRQTTAANTIRDSHMVTRYLKTAWQKLRPESSPCMHTVRYLQVKRLGSSSRWLKLDVLLDLREHPSLQLALSGDVLNQLGYETEEQPCIDFKSRISLRR